MQTPRCSFCHRPLTADESIAAGVGPECAQKQQSFLAACGTSAEEVGALVLSGDPTAQRWVQKFTAAMRAGCRGDAEMFLDAARRAARAAQSEAGRALYFPAEVGADSENVPLLFLN